MKKSNPLKAIGIIVAILFVLLTGIPLILEHFIFRNSVYSVLTNGEWAAFLGSYLGGIIGGAGTLIAMYVTTNETRKIQNENLNQLKEEHLLADKKERKQFADDIAGNISSYITDILKYTENAEKVVSLKKKKEDLHKELLTIRESIDEYNRIIKKVLTLSTESQKKAKRNLQQALRDESRVQQDMNDVDREISNLERSRLIANQCYYLLKIKLDPLTLYTQPLIEKLEDIQSFSEPGFFFDPLTFKKEVAELLQLTLQFISAYVDDDASILNRNIFSDI